MILVINLKCIINSSKILFTFDFFSQDSPADKRANQKIMLFKTGINKGRLFRVPKHLYEKWKNDYPLTTCKNLILAESLPYKIWSLSMLWYFLSFTQSCLNRKWSKWIVSWLNIGKRYFLPPMFLLCWTVFSLVVSLVFRLFFACFARSFLLSSKEKCNN